MMQVEIRNLPLLRLSSCHQRSKEKDYDLNGGLQCRDGQQSTGLGFKIMVIIIFKPKVDSFYPY